MGVLHQRLVCIGCVIQAVILILSAWTARIHAAIFLVRMVSGGLRFRCHTSVLIHEVCTIFSEADPLSIAIHCIFQGDLAGPSVDLSIRSVLRGKNLVAQLLRLAYLRGLIRLN